MVAKKVTLVNVKVIDCKMTELLKQNSNKQERAFEVVVNLYEVGTGTRQRDELDDEDTVRSFTSKHNNVFESTKR